ncbi:globin domain-containing protein [Corynebacterium gottingense]|uniref:nitric oxide dioxygenase n=1 Tax=Corynebacterium gottingense TaxID=2041036 RepID=A0ABX9UJX1_9CORY|nr:globin domain-containing protein [Corynebacterium gottingense]RMD18911.1 hemin transporter [Corynebacterium gottingense]WJZ12029.1 Flavohemoprotein [Corynebacterium gottingense]WJZ14350.1 Flavohemoprotein [Corynebacterium gottingense]
MYLQEKPDPKLNHLSEEHAEIIKATLPPVGENIETITKTFYNKMFTAHPELIANTFNRGNQKQGAQQKALAASVATFATQLVDPNAPDPVMMLDRIAHKHVSLGIRKDQYQIVHDNLMAAIAEVLGDAVTPEVAEAWDAVYWLMADVLIKHEAKLYESDGVTDGDVFRRAEVTAKEQLTDSVYAYTLTGDFTAPRPGQYTSVGVTLDDGARQLRQYSIIEGDEHSYRIAVETDGEVSTFLRDHVAIGDTVDATLAAGDLVLQDSNNPVVLISSGIGSTPMVGILGHLSRTHSDRKVTYLHADNSEDSWAQQAETRALAEALADANVTATFRSQDQRINVAEADLAGADVYLCGGANFLQGIRDDIAALPADKAPANVYFELFSPNDWLIN